MLHRVLQVSDGLSRTRWRASQTAVCAIPGRNDAQSTHAHEKSYDGMLQDDDPRPREHFACPWDTCILKAPYVSNTYAVPALATRAIPGRLLRTTIARVEFLFPRVDANHSLLPCVVLCSVSGVARLAGVDNDLEHPDVTYTLTRSLNITVTSLVSLSRVRATTHKYMHTTHT